MYLPGNEESDFRTICNFKKECKELIEKAFRKTVSIAKARGIERGIAIDEDCFVGIKVCFLISYMRTKAEYVKRALKDSGTG